MQSNRNSNNAMEPETIQKNGSNPKSQMGRGNFHSFMFGTVCKIFLMSMMLATASMGFAQKAETADNLDEAKKFIGEKITWSPIPGKWKDVFYQVEVNKLPPNEFPNTKGTQLYKPHWDVMKGKGLGLRNSDEALNATYEVMDVFLKNSSQFKSNKVNKIDGLSSYNEVVFKLRDLSNDAIVFTNRHEYLILKDTLDKYEDYQFCELNEIISIANERNPSRRSDGNLAFKIYGIKNLIYHGLYDDIMRFDDGRRTNPLMATTISLSEAHELIDKIQSDKVAKFKPLKEV